MALLKPGYWQTTYWLSSYWQQDYWLEYVLRPYIELSEGTTAAVSITLTHGAAGVPYIILEEG